MLKCLNAKMLLFRNLKNSEINKEPERERGRIFKWRGFTPLEACLRGMAIHRTKEPNNNELDGQNVARKNSRIFSRQRLLTGFTLIEILAVVSVMIILSGIVLVNYKSFGDQFALQRSANQLAQDIRRAQEMAMSAKECTHPTACPSGGVPSGGYGVYIDKFQNDRYFIYADNNADEYYSSGEAIETIYLEKEVIILSLVPPSANFSINFKPPDPTIKIKDVAGQDKENITITIALKTDNTRTKTITVNKAGLVEIK